MTTPPSDLAAQTAFTASWSAASVADELARWTDFLASHGVTWSPSSEDRDFVDRLARSAPTRAGEAIELRLAKLANDQLERAGDARRVLKLVSREPARRWYVLSPEQRRAREQSGERFESGLTGPLRQLLTIPITLGAYFAADHYCRASGMNENIAWIVALVVYVLTVRIVRGRWPLMPR